MKPKKIANRIIRKGISDISALRDERKFRAISNNYDLNGYKRVYLIHIRKTGGTSLNNMFLTLSGKDSNTLYSELSKTPSQRLCSNGLIYVGWNRKLINKGHYFYAFSHIPLHQLSLPENTFTVTCFRDPVKRVISHYNMLMDFLVNKIDHPCMETEGKWLGNGFGDFLERIPKHHLLNQLYMFSSDYSIDKAVSNVSQLSHYFFSDCFSDGVSELNRKTGLNLQPIHVRKAEYKAEISEQDLTKLRAMLDEEYRFLDVVRGKMNQ